MSTSKRLTLDVPAELDRRLTQLCTQVGARDRAELIGRAMAVYEFLIAEKAEGRITVTMVPHQIETIREVDIR